jgi:hypothetical protein
VTRAALAALALAFGLSHAPYLAATLEDIDSVNFALGVRDFDVATHRPHPPGYPVYIGLGKVAVPMVAPFMGSATQSTIEARALASLSLVGGLIGLVLLYRLFACWTAPDRLSDPYARPWRSLDVRALAATALATACPLYWYLAARPMSDLPGLAAALGAQAALSLAWRRQRADVAGERRMSPERTVASGRMIVLGALLAAIATGIRSQNAALTLPLLVGVLIDRIGRGVAGALVGVTAALAVGSMAWALPLIVASGGLDAYLAALGSQAGEDFAGVEMLSLNPTPRLVALAMVRTFVHPWDSLALGAIVVALAALGLASLAWRDRRGLLALSLVTLPYLAFHLLFQDTTFVRYALPLVPPVAYLAVTGLLSVGTPRLGVAAAGLLALWGVAVASPVLRAYGSELSPTRRALDGMQKVRDRTPPGALAMHQTFRRPIEAEAVAIEPRWPSPPRREWLELSRYWRDGHTRPIWFLADPRRSDLALVDPQSRVDRTDFAWGFSSLSELGGMRPSGVTWYRMAAPGWFVEEGWALTPETAGIARLSGHGPSLSPIVGWVRRRPGAARMLIGGRHLGALQDPSVQFTAALDDRPVARWTATAGFFVHEVALPPGSLEGDGPLARLTIWSESAGVRVVTAIEQFDLQSSGTLMWAYDAGWHEAEYTPALGVWRWASDRSTLRIVDASGPVRVTLRVEPPRRYFDEDPVVRLRAGTRALGESRFVDTSILSVLIPLETLVETDGRVTIETDRTFVPAERGGAPDRRRLGLRVFDVNIASQP